MNLKVGKILSVFLWLVALHSFIVGIGLIILPSSVFELLGFELTFDRFFSTQGGVFHIAMSVGYAIAAYDKIKFRQIILFSIIVKFIATVFLITYFLFITSQWLVILSGISDLLMGVSILYLYRALVKENYFEKKII
jgi:energy-coupling factor transporter transmembrane protein EcfT